jgi:hypothetical protein
LRYRKLSPTGDYVFGNSLNDFYINVPAAPAQAVKTRLLLWQGEWFLDLTVGTPYPSGVLGKHTQAQADTVIQDVTLNTLAVTDITTFNSQVDSDTRGYSASIKIDTLYGPSQVDLTNFINF